MKKEIREVYSPELKKDAQCDGIALTSAMPNQEVQVATKGFYSSYSTDFNQFANGILGFFLGHAELSSINHLLVHIDEKNTARIYRNFPFGQRVRIAVPKKSGQVVFKSDITDIESVFFEDGISFLDYQTSHKIIYLFRTGWHFGLYFNLSKKDPIEEILK